MINPILVYLRKDIWKVRARDYKGPKGVLIKLYKIVHLSIASFLREDLSIRASALTLYTLLSIVPVMALLFGIAKGFSLEVKLENWLLNQFPEQKVLLGQAVVFARRMLDDTRGGLVAGVGVAFLLYTVISVIGNIELAFNHIWSLAKSRSFVSKVSDYLSLMLIGPFLALAASGLNVYLATLVHKAAETAPYAHVFGRFAIMAIGFGPIFLLWLLFTFLYIFLPNTKVRFGSALFGGAVASLCYVIAQTLYIKLQIGVSNANAIYGSFAALPLFLMWLQLSWNIVLFGAEWTDVHQNFITHENEEGQPKPSFRTVKRLALGVTQLIVQRFLKNEIPLTSSQIAERLGVPARIMNDILFRLVEAKILVEIDARGDDNITYQPARDARQLTPFLIIQALENLGEEIVGGENEASIEKFSPLLSSFEEVVKIHPKNISLDKPLELG